MDVSSWNRLGEAGIAEVMRPRSPRLAKTLPVKLTAALGEQATTTGNAPRASGTTPP